MPRKSNRYRVQVLDRAIGILNVLASAVDDVTQTDLAAALHLHKSTVHRLLLALEAQRFIRRSPDGRCCLGTGLIKMGSRAVQQLEVGARAAPFLRHLVDETGETAHISVLSGSEM